MRVLECDVLVVGAGGAGLRAALAASDALAGGRVVLATKGKLGQSGVTATACSDRMAFHATLPHTEPVGPEAWVHHAEDIYRIGGEVSDWDLAEVLAQGSAEAFRYLDELGVPFAKRNGLADQFLTDGSRFARACYTGPYTANHISHALARRVRETPVQLLEECMVAEILVARGGHQVAGALALQGGELLEIHVRSIVLATGGAGNGWAINVFPEGMTGDGYALAYRAGCPLANMEFIQIGLSSVATGLACSGSMMRALPRLVNDRCEEFLPRYFRPGSSRAVIYDTLFAKGAAWPLSYEHPSHVIDLAVFRELQGGKRVFLDYSRNPEGLDLAALDQAVLRRFPNVASFYGSEAAAESPLARLLAINRPSVQWLAERGVDLAAGDLLEIAPAIQHFQGGVKIDRRAAAALPGLFAAGECAAGQHGANRPGGHSLLDGQVFGRIAGEAAAEHARTEPDPPEVDGGFREKALSDLRELRTSADGAPAGEVRRRLRELLSRAASVVRSPAELEWGLGRLAALRAGGLAVDDRGLAYCLETHNLLEVAEIVLLAASIRRESRGPHLFFAHADDLEPRPRDDETGRRYVLIRRGPRGDAVAEWADPVRRPKMER